MARILAHPMVSKTCLLALFCVIIGLVSAPTGALGVRLAMAPTRQAHRVLSPPAAALAEALTEVRYTGTPVCLFMFNLAQPTTYTENPKGGRYCPTDSGAAYAWTPLETAAVTKIGCASPSGTDVTTQNQLGCMNRIEAQVPGGPDFFTQPNTNRHCQDSTDLVYHRRRMDLTKGTPKVPDKDLEGSNALEFFAQDLLFCRGRWLGSNGIPTTLGVDRASGAVPSEWFGVTFAQATCLLGRGATLLAGTNANNAPGTPGWTMEVQSIIAHCGL